MLLAKEDGTYCSPKTLHNVIAQVTKKRDLPENCVSVHGIRKRITRGREYIPYTCKAGLSSPLLAIEPTIVAIILQMARVRESLSNSQAVELVNSIVQGTEYQQKLVDFKSMYCSTSQPTVGVGYWRGFMRRNRNKIVNVVGKKYELTRDKWTTYGNVRSMYEHIIDELINAKIAIKLDTPVWQDAEGNDCEEHKAVGCRVTYRILKPEYCIVGDETGGNLSMKGDGGRNKFLCARGDVPRNKTSGNDRHFTTIGLTLLTGDPLMCIVVMKGKRPKSEVELGIDQFIKIVGKKEDKDYLRKNCGKGKLLPGGPTCIYKGKEMSCFVRWSKSGSITSQILTEAMEELDRLELFVRENGMKPFVLFDGHGSRFGLPFLRYINNPGHEWVVCIGVPYGTALWQVGDSEQQNGNYKLKLGEAKIKLMDKKNEVNYLWN